MKKNILLLYITFITSIGFAQCDPATIKDMPTIYSREKSGNYKLPADQEKYMATIFTSAFEPALKNTKGLKGSWQALGEFKLTREGLTPSDIQMFAEVMVCSKDKKITTKNETGLMINFTLNDFQAFYKRQANISPESANSF